MGADRHDPVPVFLLSMPRSGSTLLQRLIASHPSVATGPEPTFLLPMLHIASDSEVVATFDQHYTSWAIEDFLASIDGPSNVFDEMVRAAATVAYARATPPEATHFLDKTPKYHMIADDLLRIFPESPAIALWRNPLSIIASIMSTWGGGGGRWNLQHFRLDLFEALPRMIETVSANPERIHALRYEDLVREPETTLGEVFEHIGVRPDPTVLERFAALELAGRVQDPNVSRAAFAHLRADRVDRWATILSNPLRKAWCRRYLRWLGRERLAKMGYDLDRSLDELDAVRPTSRFLATDLVLAPGDALYRTFELGLFAKKIRDRRAGRPLLAHK